MLVSFPRGGGGSVLLPPSVVIPYDGYTYFTAVQHEQQQLECTTTH